MNELCLNQEKCQIYSAGHKRRSHHIRISDKCKHWNGEYCIHPTQGVKSGDACVIEKVKGVKK